MAGLMLWDDSFNAPKDNAAAKVDDVDPPDEPVEET